MFVLLPSGVSWLASFGVASAVLGLAAYVPYIRDILRGTTHPQRASWLIWAALSSIAFGAQVHEGASASLWFAGSQVLGSGIVFVLSIFCGRGEFLSRPDERALWVAVVGIVIWYFTETAFYALALTITISLLGGMLTVSKAYQRPDSETLSKWGTALVASSLALVSVGTVDWVLLAYPMYLFALNGMIVCAILFGRSNESRYAALGLPRF